MFAVLVAAAAYELELRAERQAEGIAVAEYPERRPHDYARALDDVWHVTKGLWERAAPSSTRRSSGVGVTTVRGGTAPTQVSDAYLSTPVDLTKRDKQTVGRRVRPFDSDLVA
ncbi:hypothetical protein ACQP2T_30680 [Nonomuraea sp. CA-143628]|uniref:hypothetical protein n=1 Tax=Nonomuraea sp. CA-143628 TaxID=3239997 RepID=UPI003D89DBD4